MLLKKWTNTQLSKQECPLSNEKKSSEKIIPLKKKEQQQKGERQEL